MEILITMGKLTLMPTEATDEHLNDYQEKGKQWVQPLTLLQEGTMRSLSQTASGCEGDGFGPSIDVEHIVVLQS